MKVLTPIQTELVIVAVNFFVSYKVSMPILNQRKTIPFPRRMATAMFLSWTVMTAAGYIADQFGWFH
jgi:hypothetical protein